MNQQQHDHEHDGEYDAGHTSADPSTPLPDHTGNAQVDEVLASLAGLDERPLAEQVTVFENAHETLRAALSDAGRQAGPAPATRPFPGPRPPR